MFQGSRQAVQTAPIIKSNLLPEVKKSCIQNLEFVPIKGTNINHYVLRLDEDAGLETRDVKSLSGGPSGGGGGGGNITVNVYLDSEKIVDGLIRKQIENQSVHE